MKDNKNINCCTSKSIICKIKCYNIILTEIDANRLSLSESAVMIFVVVGLFTRPAALLLLFTMFVASVNHIVDGEFPELAILYLLIMLVLFICGPGKLSLDYHYFSKKE